MGGGKLRESLLSKTQYAESKSKSFEVYHTPQMLSMTYYRDEE